MRKANLILTTLFSIVSCSIQAQTELLQNTNFETPGANWTASGNFHYNNQYCCNYNSPTSFAYLSDASGNAMNNAVGDLGQSSIYVPANTTALTLTFYSFIGTLETTTTQAFDILHITIGNASYNEYVDFSNLDLSSGYVLKTVTISGFANYLGQYISLNFHGTTDGGLPTKFRIDDVSLKATVPNCSAVSVNSQPSNQIASTGTTAQFCVTANGTPPFTYQWYNQNGQIIGANSSCYTTPILNISDNGNQYYCIISNCSNTYQDQSNYASLTVNSSCLNVSINNTLSNQIATVGGNVTWTVNTTGTAPLNHQWYKNGIQISGANGNAYTTPNLTIGDNGNTYYCNVINCSGSGNATSNTATLNVTTNCAGASITNTLPNQNSVVGGSVTWTVNAAGTAPFTYQWYKNGIQISGAVSNIYTTPALTMSNNGNTYYCVVTNCSGAGNATSNVAALTVNGSSTPTITVTSPNGGEIWNIGSPQNITANITGTITSKIIEISYDGGLTWNVCIGYIPNSSNTINYSWTPTTQTSTTCRIRVTVTYSGGVASDISNANFSISNSIVGTGFQLNSQLSHLYWPFADASSWVCASRNGFRGGWNNPDTGCDGGPGSGHANGGHDKSELYADDWHNIVLGSCDRDFLAPLSGTVILGYNNCAHTCTTSCSNQCCKHGFGNQVVIQADGNPGFVFRVAHLKEVYVATGVHVSAGTLIGKVGSSGATKGTAPSHAHCVLYKNVNNSVDPNFYGMSSVDRLIDGNILNFQSHPAGSSIPYSSTDNYACNFIFDAVVGGTGGGSVEDPIQINGTVTFCQGDSAILTAVNGDHYYWNTGDTSQSITVYTGGSYNVVVIDSSNNPSYSQTISITVVQPSTPSIYTSSNYLCSGSNIILSSVQDFNDSLSDISSEYDNYHFLWSNNDTTYQTIINAPGTYSLTMTSGLSCVGGVASITIPLTNPPAQPTILVNGLNLASSTINGGSYQWNLFNSPIPGANSQFYTIDTSGYYTVTVTDGITGCSSISNPVYVVDNVGMESMVFGNTLKIYPNPTQNKFNIDFEVINSYKQLLISVNNSVGQTMLSDKIDNILPGKVRRVLDVQKLSNGIYHLQIRLDDGTTINRKVVIQK